MTTPTIYLVTSGDHEDYSIEAVFTDRERAERYVAWYNGPEGDRFYGARVEEWELDPATPTTGRWEIRGPLHEWEPGREDELGNGWWSRESTERTSASRDIDPDRTIWIHGFGKDRESALRSGRALARRIKAGKVTVP